jgi:glycerophosphoryl diester phosphodiesterase
MSRVTYAHRGLHGDGAPENSPTAFARAIEGGFGIECDVQRSGDGHALVFHDWELDRLTGEIGAVSDRTVGELTKVTLSGCSDQIPTLRDVLRQIGGRVPLLIEVKSKVERRVNSFCLAVRRDIEGYDGQVAVMSFDPRVSHWFRKHAPHIVRGLVVTEEDSRTFSGTFKRHVSLWHAKPDFLAYDIRDLPSAFAGAQRKRGLPLLTWTVRSAELRERANEFADAPIAEGAGIA